MDCSTPGFPVHHQLPELTQTHVHRVGDAIQPSHSLSSPSHPTFSLSQHQSLFQWVSSSHQVAKYWHFSFSISPPVNIQDWFPLGLTGWISLQSRRLSGSMVENLSAREEAWVRSLVGEDSLKKNMAIHSSILAWKILWTEEPGGLQSMGSQKSWTLLSD